MIFSLLAHSSPHGDGMRTFPPDSSPPGHVLHLT